VEYIPVYLHVVISSRLRLEKGTETGDMATIHAFLRNDYGDVNNAEDTIQYGPSTSNKVLCSKMF
jgi:hypothetical protein